METRRERKSPRNALGRGLNALISKSTSRESIAESLAISNPELSPILESTNVKSLGNESIKILDTNRLLPNPFQPREQFNEHELYELAESIKSLGVLQPVLVRPAKNDPGAFEIVAGERRIRAAQLAKITQVPAIILDIDDAKALEIALVENLQRQDLNPIEEAQAYQRLIDQFALTQAVIAERVGKDRASIANCLRLLKLPPEVIDMLRQGKITLGHAKAILTIREPSAQISLAKKVISDGLSVRLLEQIVARAVILEGARKSHPQKASPALRSPGTFPGAIDRLRDALGTKVTIKHYRSGHGRIEIEYFSEQELDRIIERICHV